MEVKQEEDLQQTRLQNVPRIRISKDEKKVGCNNFEISW